MFKQSIPGDFGHGYGWFIIGFTTRVKIQKDPDIEPCHDDHDAPKSELLNSQCGGTLLPNLSCAGTPRKVADFFGGSAKTIHGCCRCFLSLFKNIPG